jgi:hypothetical protein
MKTENIPQVLYWIIIRNEEVGNFIVKKFEYKVATSLITALFTRRFPTLCRDEAIKIWNEDVHDSATFVRASEEVCTHLFASVDDGKPLRPGPKELEALRDESIMKAQIAAIKRIVNPSVEAVNRFLIDMNMIFSVHLPSVELFDFLRDVAFPLAHSSKHVELIRSCYVFINASLLRVTAISDPLRIFDIISQQLGFSEVVKLARYILDDGSEAAGEVVCHFWNVVSLVSISITNAVKLCSEKRPIPLAECESIFKWYANTLSPHQSLLKCAFKKLIQLYNAKKHDSDETLDHIVTGTPTLLQEMHNPKFASICNSMSDVLLLYDSFLCVPELPDTLVRKLKNPTGTSAKEAAQEVVVLSALLMMMPNGSEVFKGAPHQELQKLARSIMSK